MRFFFGSVPEKEHDRTPSVERQRVKKHASLWKAAADLGRAAAARGHTIMVGSDRPTTIDHHLVRNDYSGSRNVILDADSFLRFIGPLMKRVRLKASYHLT